MLKESSTDKTSQCLCERSSHRNIYFLFFNVLAILLFYAPLKELFALSLSYNPTYSHIPLIPIISAYLVYSNRGALFSDSKYSITTGSILIIIGLTVSLFGKSHGSNFNQNDYLSLMTFSAVVFWCGGCVLFYGITTFKSAFFPFLFLLFMIPIPTLLIDKVIAILQDASAEVAHVFFFISGIPFFREGPTFHLSNLSVEVAEQCSGIRSSIALTITAFLAGYFFLNTSSRKIILLLSVFPLTVFKNGLRILTLALLGNYVDVRILSSALHKKGGIPFFILAFVFLTAVLWILKKTERVKKQ